MGKIDASIEERLKEILLPCKSEGVVEELFCKSDFRKLSAAWICGAGECFERCTGAQVMNQRCSFLIESNGLNLCCRRS